MKKTRTTSNSKSQIRNRKFKQKFPPGWNERRIRAVIRHYEQLTDEDLAREIEAAPEVTEESLISVPTKLLPAIRKVILQHQKNLSGV